MRQSDIEVRVAKLDGKLRADVLLIPVRVVRGKAEAPAVRGLTRGLRERLRELVGRYHGAKQAGSMDAQVLPAGAPFARIALVCVGDAKPVKTADVRKAAGLAMGWCAKHRAARVAVAIDPLRTIGSDESVGDWVEAAILGAYRFVHRRSKPPENGAAVAGLCVATASSGTAKIGSLVRRAGMLAESVNLARTLGHEPPNVINPVTLAGRLRAIARRYALRCRVMDDRQMRAKGMGAILAVGRGSATKPRIIVLEHRGTRPKSRPVTLVGKAVTLDTGGYSIKPAASIPAMKYDKCGGMAVAGALVAAARLKLKRRVVGIIGAAENMISGEAYRPGDIVTAASGTTIEILNTDAEGRLVLADCLHYAQHAYDPAVIIDLATLTGACEIALGDLCAGLLSTDDRLAEALIASGERTGERLWRLPLWPEYREQIVSTEGDIKNTGGRTAGCVTAAMFLKEFVGAKVPWAHLDIAGVADVTKRRPTCPVGATGFGVRLLIDYIQRHGG